MQVNTPRYGFSRWWVTFHAPAGGVGQASAVTRHWRFKAQLHEAAGFSGFLQTQRCAGVSQASSGGRREPLMHKHTCSLKSQGALPLICITLVVYSCTINISFLHRYAQKEVTEIKTHSCTEHGITLPSHKNRNLEVFSFALFLSVCTSDVYTYTKRFSPRLLKIFKYYILLYRGASLSNFLWFRLTKQNCLYI